LEATIFIGFEAAKSVVATIGCLIFGVISVTAESSASNQRPSPDNNTCRCKAFIIMANITSAVGFAYAALLAAEGVLKAIN
jgi:hypothetical protein